jgi:hypothetical protein
MSSYYIIFALFAVVAYFIVTDENVAAAFTYVLELVSFQIKRKWWWITNNPNNPIVKYIVWRRSMKTAKELLKKIKEKQNV